MQQVDKHPSGPSQPSEAQATINFQLLGPLRYISDGQLLRISGARQQRVLALLALNANTIVTFDRLIDAMWERPPRTARQQLFNVIGSLRGIIAVLNEATISTDQLGYQLEADPESIDLFRFRADVRAAETAQEAGRTEDAVRLLRSALAWWNGPALEGVTSHCFAGITAQLQEQQLSAIERLIDLRIALGESASLVGELIDLVSQHPFRESLRASLMVALDGSGRQAEALATFEDGRRLLAEELGLDPGSQLRNLQAAILTGRSVESVKPSKSPSAAAPPQVPAPGDNVVPRYLPHDIKEFTGRARELEELLAEIEPSSTTALAISAIGGMGGIGKTTFAVHIAHRVVANYPDGQYFIDLRGFSPGASPLPPSVVLESLLKDCGLSPGQIPSGIDELSRLWRSQLAGKRVLLVLDNAVDEAQVEPLMPGAAGSLVLVTSRRRLPALRGCSSVILDVLDVADARDLFCRIVGMERVAGRLEAVSEIIEICGRLPLSIRIAAALVRDRKAWTIEYLAEQLRSATRRKRLIGTGVAELGSVAELSYSQLQPEDQRFFRLQGLNPCIDFDARSAAALAGIDVGEAESALERLLDESLLLQYIPGRYFLHDLVRGCAREICTAEDSVESRAYAHQRLIDYYLQAVGSWCSPFAKGSYKFTPDLATAPSANYVEPSAQDAMRRLESEYSNIAEMVRFASTVGSHRSAWQLACLLQPYLSILGYGTTGIELFDIAFESARTAGDERGVRLTQTVKALILRYGGALPEAISLLEETAAMSRRAGDRVAEMYQTINLGLTLSNDWQFTVARDRLMNARSIAVDLGDDVALIAIIHNLGVTFRAMGQLDDALQYFLQSRALQKPGASVTSESLLASNFGSIYHAQGRHVEAALEFEQALRLARSAKFRYGETAALVGLGTVQRLARNFEGSLASCHEALAAAREANIRESECQALICIGDTLADMGARQESEASYDQAREAALESGLKLYAGWADEGLAHLYVKQDDFKSARQYWRRALELYSPDLGETNNVRRHLEAEDLLSATCQRCAVAR